MGHRREGIVAIHTMDSQSTSSLKGAKIVEIGKTDDDDDASDPSKIRSRAEVLLDWADRAIEKRRNSNNSNASNRSTCDGSWASTAGTELQPRESPVSKARRGRDQDDTENHFIISNMDHVEVVNPCPCHQAMVTQKPEHVEFYLPKPQVICNCNGKTVPELAPGTNRYQLVNILREWQVEFLKSMGIETALQLVDAQAKRSKAVAREMRRWRKAEGRFAVRTESCRVALHIWSRTCKAVLKAVVVQGVDGKAARPEFLDISLSDSHSVSTLGFNTTTGAGGGVEDSQQQSVDNMLEAVLQ